MTDRELMQQALLKMEYMLNNGEWYEPEKTIEALRARLAQPEPEPVAWEPQIIRLYSKDGLLEKQLIRRTPDSPLEDYYPQREWVGLTDDDIKDCLYMSIEKTCRAIEAKLKEKNSE